MKTIRTAFLLVPAAVLALSAAALADEPAPPRGGQNPAAVKAAAEKRTEAKAGAAEKRAEAADKRDEAKDKRDEAKDKRDEAKDKAADKQEEKAEVREAFLKLKETRKERRKERVEEIRKKWGDLHKQPAIKNELRTHAWRMARLQRMKALAKADGKDKLVTKIDELIEKEKARHEKKMQHFKDKGGAQ